MSVDLFYAGLSNQGNGIVFGAIKETRLASLMKNQELWNQNYKPNRIIIGKPSYSLYITSIWSNSGRLFKFPAVHLRLEAVLL